MKPQTRFLLAGLASAANTANAIRPAARSGRASIPSFAYGLPPSELPGPTGTIELGLAALLARSGGTKGWQGKVGLAAHAASIAGLVAIDRRARAADDIMEAALAEAFGADYQDRIREPFSPQPAAPLTRQPLWPAGPL